MCLSSFNARSKQTQLVKKGRRRERCKGPLLQKYVLLGLGKFIEKDRFSKNHSTNGELAGWDTENKTKATVFAAKI